MTHAKLLKAALSLAATMKQIALLATVVVAFFLLANIGDPHFAWAGQTLGCGAMKCSSCPKISSYSQMMRNWCVRCCGSVQGQSGPPARRDLRRPRPID